MKSTLINFDTFVKGPGLNDPKKVRSVEGKPETLKKEKSIDQVKYCDLSKLKTVEADYEKTKKEALKEGISSVAQSIQVKVDQVDQQIAKLDQKDPNYTANKTNLDTQKQTLITQLEAQNAKDSKTPQIK